MKTENNSKLTKFINSRSFFLALALCMVGTAVTAFFAINSTIDGIADLGEPPINSNSVPGFIDVEGTQDDEPVDPDDNPSVVDEPDPEPEPEPVPDPEPTVTEPDPVAVEPEVVPTEELTPIFTMPVSGSIIGNFSQGELVKNETLGDWRTHDGIDIKADSDTIVKVAAAGTVSDIYDDAIFGSCVVVTHADGYETHYYSLGANLSVSLDEEIDAGRAIGTVSSSAAGEEHLPPHLHFGVKKDGKWIDPLSVISES